MSYCILYQITNLIKCCNRVKYKSSITTDQEEDEHSIHMSEGGQRESYEDLRLMLSELLDEKERWEFKEFKEFDEFDEFN